MELYVKKELYDDMYDAFSKTAKERDVTQEAYYDMVAKNEALTKEVNELRISARAFKDAFKDFMKGVT